MAPAHGRQHIDVVARTNRFAMWQVDNRRLVYTDAHTNKIVGIVPIYRRPLEENHRHSFYITTVYHMASQDASAIEL